MDQDEVMKEFRSYELIESDWKLLRKRLPGWQEAYMGKLVNEYMEILKSGKRPSEKFWTLDKRIKKDKRNTGVLVTDLRRSRMLSLFDELRADGVIHEKDMEGFSQDLKDYMRYGWVLSDRLRKIKDEKSGGKTDWTRWAEYEEAHKV